MDRAAWPNCGADALVDTGPLVRLFSAPEQADQGVGSGPGNELGNYEVYVQAFPATGAKWQVSQGGGSHPKWRRDGNELFYLTTDRK